MQILLIYKNPIKLCGRSNFYKKQERISRHSSVTHGIMSPNTHENDLICDAIVGQNATKLPIAFCQIAGRYITFVEI